MKLQFIPLHAGNKSYEFEGAKAVYLYLPQGTNIGVEQEDSICVFDAPYPLAVRIPEDQVK